MSNALWLDSLDIGPVEDDGRRRTFSATCNVVPEHCPKCGNIAIYRHGTETNRFMDTLLMPNSHKKRGGLKPPSFSCLFSDPLWG